MATALRRRTEAEAASDELAAMPTARALEADPTTLTVEVAAIEAARLRVTVAVTESVEVAAIEAAPLIPDAVCAKNSSDMG
ncbi:hypothetical protein GCM10017056_47800 [Seohaeicola zhoushanensis]|uniref:Uncharacterized protein n=1 Tax=Seohaeicola zhoushanensis TaxID=1569283 RepID=A0A8J3H3C1_9RHOB|nr:hypothetical protein GCM10017056_47800 [Seohaeicola zhoushanensis]